MACTVNPAMGPNTPTIPHENETRGQDHVRGACLSLPGGEGQRPNPGNRRDGHKRC